MTLRPLIVGGGPAGSAAAIALARGGARPLLLERHAGQHDALCGGFLGWDALRRLEMIGIDSAALGARPITRLRLIAGDRLVERALPGIAAGLSRRALDAALLAAAADAGASIERGVAVREAVDATQLRLDDGAVIAADSLFLATGKRELRGLARPRAAGEDPAVGLRLRLGPIAALDGAIELHLFDRGYAGLLRQEDGATNFCLSVSRSRLDEAGGRPEQLLASLAEDSPRLADRLTTPALTPVQAVAAVPYGWRARQGVPGLFRLGDQAGVIASLAGDGVAIALASGWSAAKAWLAGGGGAALDWQPAFARQLARPLGVSEMLRRYAQRRPAQLLQLAGIAPWLVGLAASATRIDH
jgi:flavin-dependent dehydrogenase